MRRITTHAWRLTFGDRSVIYGMSEVFPSGAGVTGTPCHAVGRWRISRDAVHLVLVWLMSVSCFGLTVQAQVTSRADPSGPLPDGTPLRGDQFPRFLTPSHDGEFGFDDLVVLGQHPTIQFERLGAGDNADVIVERWPRTGTTDIRGRTASIFRLSWSATHLDDVFRTERWGVDRPTMRWGEIVVDSDAGERRRDLFLQLAPSNLPTAPLVSVDEFVQYASHSVNIWVPEFGDSLVEAGVTAFDLATVSRRFFERFEDEYDTLAIVSQTAYLIPPLGFRLVVRNALGGVGLPLFDVSADYGSRGVLQGVEAYPPGEWATQRATLHQQGHQWSEYSDAWGGLSIDRVGDAPDHHVPLLTPGEVLSGAVLEATRRVAAGGDGVFVIERSTPAVTYHPLTLYRMGLLPADELPDLRVFSDQSQFGSEARSVPPVGTPLSGTTQPFFIQDLIAADGRRTGPAVDRIRRALVYVTRSGLASSEEMNVVNFYAARVAATHGVSSWDGYPSFFEATGEQATLRSEVIPKPGVGVGPAASDANVTYLNVATDALRGLRLDAQIPGRLLVGQAETISGIVTASDRDDFTIACLRFIRYGAADANETFECSSLVGNQFSLQVEFSEDQRGTYTVEPFLFWNESGAQPARSRYGVITVE